MNVKNGYTITKSAALDFVDDNAMTLGASLAFYAALSMAPLVLVLLAITSLSGAGGADTRDPGDPEHDGAAGRQRHRRNRQARAAASDRRDDFRDRWVRHPALLGDRGVRPDAVLVECRSGMFSPSPAAACGRGCANASSLSA